MSSLPWFHISYLRVLSTCLATSNRNAAGLGANLGSNTFRNLAYCVYWLECVASKRDSVFSSPQIPHRKSDSLRKKSSCLEQFVAPALQVNQDGAAGVASLYITEAYFEWLLTVRSPQLEFSIEQAMKKVKQNWKQLNNFKGLWTPYHNLISLLKEFWFVLL